MGEPEGGQGTRDQRSRHVVDGELGEREPAEIGAPAAGRRPETGSGTAAGPARADRLCEGEQRAHRVGGGVPGVLLLVDVVEHLESDIGPP